MKEINEYKLTRDVTVAQLRAWISEQTDDSKFKIVDLIRHRLENRYLKHVKCVDSGFLIMAVSCFVIETLQSFREGVQDTNGLGQRMFKNFFNNEQVNFPGFNEELSAEFYKHIRCGILHQSETTNAWRVLRTGELIDQTEYSINADLFLESLKKSVGKYLDELTNSDFKSDLWKNAFVKLNDICVNCTRKQI
jgi:hypothetical protein